VIQQKKIQYFKFTMYMNASHPGLEPMQIYGKLSTKAEVNVTAIVLAQCCQGNNYLHSLRRWLGRSRALDCGRGRRFAKGKENLKPLRLRRRCLLAASKQ
jgi:hypothetical protein